MSVPPDHISEDDVSYRRGLVLGLTMAEVMILVLFCLLLTALYLLKSKEDKIKALTGKNGSEVYLVSRPILREVRQQFANVQTQQDLDDAFQKLLLANDAVAQITTSSDNNTLPFPSSDSPKKRINDLVQVTNTAKDIVGSSGRPTNSIVDIQNGLDGAIKDHKILDRWHQLHGSGAPSAKTAIAGELCADQYSTEKQRDECVRKIVDLAGGKGLELASCWWDKTVAPWKTKDIFDVAITENGFIIRSLDPATEEYRQQKQKLPLQDLELNTELTEVKFLSQTAALLAWSNANKCRFFVRLYDQTGPQAKMLYQARVDAVEKRFYKEKTGRVFAVQ